MRSRTVMPCGRERISPSVVSQRQTLQLSRESWGQSVVLDATSDKVDL